MSQPRAEGEDTILTLTFSHTTGLVNTPAGLAPLTEHVADLHFPRFFPAIPIEAYLRRPVFHPNVDPANGFVCLWGRFSPGDTVITAALYLQQIIAWRAWNLSAEHVIQSDAAAWHAGGAAGHSLPLPCRFLLVPEELDGLDVYPAHGIPVRRRLG